MIFVQFVVMRFIFLILIFSILIPSVNIKAEETLAENDSKTITVPAPDFKSLKQTDTQRVDKVIDGLTILMKDKSIIRLASLDIPDFGEWRDAPLSSAAQDFLNRHLPEGTETMIYQTRSEKTGRSNRMGHDLAHLMTKGDVKKGENPLWLNGALLAQGFARVQFNEGSVQLAQDMLTLEAAARQEKIGLWSDDSDHRILTPETIATQDNLFVLVEGTITKTATVRNNIYLNFGADWKTDFTIMITPDLRKKFSQKGINILGLAGQTVRVRGWVREYNGPLIELDIPEHLEIL